MFGKEKEMALALEIGMVYKLHNVAFRRRSTDGLIGGRMGDAGGIVISQRLDQSESSLQLQDLLE